MPPPSIPVIHTTETDAYYERPRPMPLKGAHFTARVRLGDPTVTPDPRAVAREVQTGWTGLRGLLVAVNVGRASLAPDGTVTVPVAVQGQWPTAREWVTPVQRRLVAAFGRYQGQAR